MSQNTKNNNTINNGNKHIEGLINSPAVFQSPSLNYFQVFLFFRIDIDLFWYNFRLIGFLVFVNSQIIPI